MNKHQIDDLFRNKLEDYRPTASKDAWTKLQGNLEDKKNNKKWLYLRIAAGLSLLALVTYILIFNAGNEAGNNKLTVQNETNNASQEPAMISNELTENENTAKEESTPDITEKDQNLSNNKNTGVQVAQSDIATKQIKGKGIESTMNQDLYYSEILIRKVEVPVIDIDQLTTLLTANDDIEDENQSVTITYVIGNINPVILDKEEPKQSKLKKAWEFAKNVKNGEEKLPNLRVIKNELLAFNKKKKNKTQENNND